MIYTTSIQAIYYFFSHIVVWVFYFSSTDQQYIQKPTSYTDFYITDKLAFFSFPLSLMVVVTSHKQNFNHEDFLLVIKTNIECEKTDTIE